MSHVISRRNLLQAAAALPVGALAANAAETPTTRTATDGEGTQRLSLEHLRRWESLGYGMFLHFGMSTFVRNELPDGKAPPTAYAPDRLDVAQWVSVARDAGMKYAVLTAKHVAGHCLWPSKQTDYTVANSGNKTDVIETFIKACDRTGVLPGLYYCSWDNHHRFGGRTPSDQPVHWCSGRYDFRDLQKQVSGTGNAALPAYVTSVYQDFQTAQLTELLTQYGPIAEVWIDIPGILGRGYRTFLYGHIAALQPQTVIMMNSGISTGEEYSVDYAWPSDLIAIERRLPPDRGHQKWRTIEGKRCYMPGEVCDPIGKEWFHVPGDAPRPLPELVNMLTASRQRGANLLLDVPPDAHGLIPEETVQALVGLRRAARL